MRVIRLNKHTTIMAALLQVLYAAFPILIPVRGLHKDKKKETGQRKLIQRSGLFNSTSYFASEMV